MNCNQQLNQQFMQSKMLHRQNIIQGVIANKRKYILKKFATVLDDEVITLQTSIGLLKKFNIIQELENETDIFNINMLQKSSDGMWKKKQFQINECRLLMHLWDVIEQDSIQARQFKEIIMLMLDNQGKNRDNLLCELFGEKESIWQFVEAWDAVMHQQCSLLIKKIGHLQIQNGQINDISIIKSKNQGVFNDNKENLMSLTNSGITSVRESIDNKKIDSIQLKNMSQKHIFEKSFHKKNRFKLQKSESIGKISKYNSQNQTQKYLITLRPIQFFQENEIMTVDEEKRLIDRLYNNDMYTRREEAKKQLQKQRMIAELNSCTFKPKITKNSIAMSKSNVSSKQIKGYKKTIQRIKCGYQKNKQLRQNLQYRIWKEVSLPTQKNRIFNPPKFMNRTKEAQVQLFKIHYWIGRHNIKISVKETDRINDIVQRVGKIYSLRQQVKNQMRQSLQEEINKYYQQKVRKQAEDQLIN